MPHSDAALDPTLELLDGSRVLQIQARLGESVLFCRQLTAQGRAAITAGSSPDADLPCELAGGAASVPLVEVRDGRFWVLAAPGARTEARRDDGWQPVPAPHLVGVDERLRVELGAAVLELASVSPARPLRRGPLAIGRAGLGVAAASLGVHLLLVGLMLALPPGGRMLSRDPLPSEPAFVRVRVPRRVALAGPGGAAGWGHDARAAAGASGRRGSPRAPVRAGRPASRGPSDNPDPRLARQLAEAAVRRASPLAAVSGAVRTLLDANQRALGRDAMDAMGGLNASATGEGYGFGGLGLASNGLGISCTSGGRCGGPGSEGTIGLGSLGIVGRGGGSGNGYGRAGGIGWLGRTRRACAPDCASVIAGCGGTRSLVTGCDVRGSLDKELIRRVVRRHVNEVRYCYVKELQSHPALEGRVRVQFTVLPGGEVGAATVAESTVGHARLEGCVASAVRRWHFPRPRGGGLTVVSYPFVFHAAGEDG